MVAHSVPGTGVGQVIMHYAGRPRPGAGMVMVMAAAVEKKEEVEKGSVRLIIQGWNNGYLEVMTGGNVGDYVGRPGECDVS